MTLFQVEELCQYWADHPPVHLLVAGFMGVKPPVRQATTGADVAPALPAIRVMAAIPGLDPGTVDNLPTPIFDATELMRMRPT